jgi:septal ring factor EnvC (AmiA/AmiB activator)
MQMNFRILLTAILLVGVVGSAWAQQEMTKEEWQKQITELTAKRDELKSKLDALNRDIEELKRLGTAIDGEIQELEAQVMALVELDAAGVRAFEAQLDRIDQWLNEMARLSNPDLWARQKELDDIQKLIDEARTKKASYLPRYNDRLDRQQSQLNGLRETLRKYEESITYTVGTWSKDRDCLWNIAKKPTVYGNAFLWPKLWVGNRDKIKNPDIIQPGQQLRIPPKGELTSDERAAERSYWKRKQAEGSVNP